MVEIPTDAAPGTRINPGVTDARKACPKTGTTRIEGGHEAGDTKNHKHARVSQALGFDHRTLFSLITRTQLRNTWQQDGCYGVR